MNYGYCKCCRKVIRYQKMPLCNDCKEKYLHSVKEYIYEHGDKSAQEIHEATNVPVGVIEYFLKNDYLTIKASEEELRKNLMEQERIRKLVLLNALTNSFKNEDENKKESDYELMGEMHFLGKDRRR